MKEWINIIVRKLLRMFFHVFYILPIRSNRILFESYGGMAYNCNPKYLCEYINRYYNDQFELIWVFNEPQKHINPKYIKAVKRHSFCFFIYRFTSKFIICNKTDEVYLPKRKKQIVINTWHAGGAYKKVGLSFDKTYNRATKWQDEIVRKETSIYISSSNLFTKFNIEEAYKYHGEIINCGMPRNDIFFNKEIVVDIRRKIDVLYGTQDMLLILYAPTFRGDYEDNVEISFSLPVDRIINSCEQKYKKKVMILNRSHYNDKNKLTIKSSYRNRVVDVNEYEDMQELLAAADILITDYSSSMWDFALLHRPCFLYVPDISQYNDERGTYTPIDWWPGVICETEEELIKQLLEIDEEAVYMKAEKHLKQYGSYENGHASQIIVNRMLDCLNKDWK